MRLLTADLLDKSKREYFDYDVLIELTDLEILASESFGSYQGDACYVLRRRDDNRIGYAVVGYGSCSGCDALEGCSNNQERADLVNSIVEDIEWFSSPYEAWLHFARPDVVKWHDSQDEIVRWMERQLNKPDAELRQIVKEATT